MSSNELEEIRRDAYDNTYLSKERAKIFHGRLNHGKQFFAGQKVLLYDSHLHLFPRKLRSTWIGPYIVIKAFPRKAVEIRDPTKDKIFKVNGRRLKPLIELLSGEDVECVLLYEPLSSE